MFPEIDFEARRPWLVRTLDDLQSSGARIVVKDRHGAPAGFVAVDPPRAALEQLAVHPAHQGRGVASALMETAKALSPAGLDLSVNRDNMQARRFYVRHGFVEVASGTNPLSDRPTLLLRWRGDGSRLRSIATHRD